MSERDALDRLLNPCISDDIVPGDMVFFNDALFKGVKRRALLQTTVALCVILGIQPDSTTWRAMPCSVKFTVIVVRCYAVDESGEKLVSDGFQIIEPGDIGEINDHYINDENRHITWRFQE